MVKIIELIALVSIYAGLILTFALGVLVMIKGNDKMFENKLDTIILKIATMFIVLSGILMALGNLTSYHIRHFNH